MIKLMLLPLRMKRACKLGKRGAPNLSAPLPSLSHLVSFRFIRPAFLCNRNGSELSGIIRVKLHPMHAVDSLWALISRCLWPPCSRCSHGGRRPCEFVIM
jgi:hypothetical protein